LLSSTPTATLLWQILDFVIQGDAMSFLAVLEEVGKDFEKGLVWAVEYAVPVENW
jgi:hypothetical protein